MAVYQFQEPLLELQPVYNFEQTIFFTDRIFLLDIQEIFGCCLKFQFVEITEFLHLGSLFIGGGVGELGGFWL